MNKKGIELSILVDYKKSPIVNSNSEDSLKPAIIILHGFKGYKEENHLESIAVKLSENGFVAIRFDCSGSGESGGNMESDYLFSNYLQDLEEVYEYVKSLDYIDSEKIGLCGHSLGAMLAIIFAVKHPELNAIVSISPPDVPATKDVLGKELQKWKEQGYLEFPTSLSKKSLKIPFSYIQDIKNYTTIYYAKKINTEKTPTLIVIGKEDKTVLPEQSRAVANAIPNGLPPLEIEGMNHSYKNDPEMTDFVTARIVEFFNMHLS